jgi:hypothetical protein
MSEKRRQKQFKRNESRKYERLLKATRRQFRKSYDA